jgi:hypothetical protein
MTSDPALTLLPQRALQHPTPPGMARKRLIRQLVGPQRQEPGKIVDI